MCKGVSGAPIGALVSSTHSEGIGQTANIGNVGNPREYSHPLGAVLLISHGPSSTGAEQAVRKGHAVISSRGERLVHGPGEGSVSLTVIPSTEDLRLLSQGLTGPLRV